MGGSGYFKGKRYTHRVHGVIFTFAVDLRRAQMIKENVKIALLDKLAEYGNIKTWSEGEEFFVEVSSSEASGLGFYRAAFLEDDVETEKVDVRFR